MLRRRTDLDPTVWAAFDAGALLARWRSTFLARRDAVELYVANVSVTQIEQRTGIDRRQLYRSVATRQAASGYALRALPR